MSRILMLVINPMTADTRVEKEAGTLGAAGHDVTVVATHAEGLPLEEERAGYRVLRVPYRRVVKDRVVGPLRAARARRASRAEERSLLVSAGLPDRPTARDAALAGRVALARAWTLAGGAVLKTARTRMLVPEYWGSIASTLPARLPRPDVIHAHDLGPLAAAARLADAWTEPGSRRPSVVYDSHELYVEQQTSWTDRERLAWRVHERRWIRRADLVITVSEGIAGELQSRYGLDERPVVVLNSPPDEPAPAASDVRSDAGLGEQDLLAVYVGTVKPGRGVDRLVPALEHGHWHLAIVGGGEGQGVRDVREAAESRGVAGRLHMLPGVPAATLPSYISSADVGVHPMEPTCMNHELALPNKLFDYLFAGLPVAVSDLREMAALVRGHDLGTTFAPDAPVAISAAVVAAASAHPRPRLGPVAPAALLDELGWSHQSRRLLGAYERL